MTLFLLVTDTASSSSFMNCLLSSLHFILWDLMTPSGGVLNIWRDIKPLDCSLWPSKLFAISILLSTFFSCPVGALFHSVSLPNCASQSLQTPWIPCFRDTVRGEAIFCSQSANLDLQKNGGQGEGFRYPGPCWKEGESIALGHGTTCLPRKGVLSCVCT